MRDLLFNVNKQSLTKNESCDFSNIVSGTEGYLKAKFRFDSEWNGYGRVAVFVKLLEEHPVIIGSSGECIIPKEALDWDYFKVYVIGRKNGQKIVTNAITINQERSK